MEGPNKHDSFSLPAVPSARAPASRAETLLVEQIEIDRLLQELDRRQPGWIEVLVAEAQRKRLIDGRQQQHGQIAELAADRPCDLEAGRIAFRKHNVQDHHVGATFVDAQIARSESVSTAAS